MAACQVSSRAVVREGLLALQRRLALEAPAGAILEGRDIGTVVFPDADAKFFLEANPEVRARRRFEELFQKGVERSLQDVLADQTKRDRDDTERRRGAAQGRRRTPCGSTRPRCRSPRWCTAWSAEIRELLAQRAG